MNNENSELLESFTAGLYDVWSIVTSRVPPLGRYINGSRSDYFVPVRWRQVSQNPGEITSHWAEFRANPEARNKRPATFELIGRLSVDAELVDNHIAQFGGRQALAYVHGHRQVMAGSRNSDESPLFTKYDGRYVAGLRIGGGLLRGAMGVLTDGTFTSFNDQNTRGFPYHASQQEFYFI